MKPYAIILFFNFFIFGCGYTPIPLFQAESSEYLKITSPDGLVDAIVIYRDSGATSRGGYQLYLLPSGGIVEQKAEINTDNLVFGAEAEKLEISWIKDKDLQINCKRARIGNFTNSWSSKEIQYYRYLVEIRISATCRLHSHRLGDRGNFRRGFHRPSWKS